MDGQCCNHIKKKKTKREREREELIVIGLFQTTHQKLKQYRMSNDSEAYSSSIGDMFESGTSIGSDASIMISCTQSRTVSVGNDAKTVLYTGTSTANY